MARQIVPDIDALMLPTLRRQQPDWAPLTETLSALYSRGWNINWKAFHAGRSHTAVQLPTYPFERETFWISAESKASSASANPPVAGYSDHPLLGLRVDLPSSEGIFIWQASLDMQRCFVPPRPLHSGELAKIFPATAYIEMALAAAAETQPQETYVLIDLSFHKPLLLKRETRQVLQLWMRKGSDGSFETRIFSRDALIEDPEGAKSSWTLHMTGTLTLRGLEKSETDLERFDLSSIRSRCPEEIDGTAFYENQAKKGNQWGPCLRGDFTRSGEAMARP